MKNCYFAWIAKRYETLNAVVDAGRTFKYRWPNTR